MDQMSMFVRLVMPETAHRAFVTHVAPFIAIQMPVIRQRSREFVAAFYAAVGEILVTAKFKTNVA
jgi:hypothetical protein